MTALRDAAIFFGMLFGIAGLAAMPFLSPSCAWVISMSDEQGELNFADAPVSLAAKRAEKADDGRLWTPRDALIDMLRDIDIGKINPAVMVVAAKTVNPDGSYKLHTVNAGGANRHELIGLVADVQRSMIDHD